MSVLILTYTSSTSTSVLLNYTGGGTVVTPLLLVNARLYQNFVSNASTITVNGLSPDTEYSFQWSIDEFVVSNLVSASTSIIPIPTPPVLSLGSVGTQSVSLLFSGAVGSTSYAVFVNGVEDTNALIIGSTAVLYGLSPSTTYSIQLEAINSTGSTFSPYLSVTTSATPVVPSPLTIAFTSATDTTLTFSFTGGVGATSYVAFRNGFQVVSTNLSVVGSSFTISGLVASTPYLVQFQALNEAGSTDSNNQSVSTTTPPLNPPTAPIITFVSATQTSLTFSFTGGVVATSYSATVNSVEVDLIDLDVTPPTFLITGLTPDTSYDVVFTATNTDGSTPSNKVTASTEAPPVDPPTSPLVISGNTIGSTDLYFSFTGGVGATSYSATTNGTAVASSNLFVITGGTPSFRIAGLTPSTSYDVIFTATNSAGSVVSNTVTRSTSALTPPTTPVITFGSATQTTLTFTYTGGLGATSYSATVNGTAVASGDLDTSTPGTFVISGLTAGTTYAVIFTATNSDGSTASSPVDGTTSSTPTPPTTPVITFGSATETALTFTYTGGVGATSYSATVNSTAVAPGDLDTSTPGTFVISSLTAGTTYAVVFTATNTTGSTPSSPVDGTTSSTPTPPTIPVITFDSATETALTFTYTGGVGATSYSATVNGTAVASGDLAVAPTTFTISGLTAGTTYDVVLTATNTTGSTPSSPVEASTSSTPTPIPTLLVLTFLVSPVAGQYQIDSGTNTAIGNWDLVAGTITGASSGASGVISYLTGLQTAGCKVLVSIGGQTASLPNLFGGASQPTDLAQSIAHSLFGGTGPNPLSFQKTDWSTFIFDGIDYDIEANTPTASDIYTFHSEFKTQVPSSIVMAAPLSPNVEASFPNGLNGNGAYGIVSGINISAAQDLSTTYNSSVVNCVTNPVMLSTMDYIFIQCYNQTGWYYTSPDTQIFINMLASYGYACLQASPIKCKIVIGLASADGIPIFEPSTSSLLNTCISDANAIIVTARGPTNISDWLAGVGMWNSPTNMSVITSIYSNNTLSNLPADATILYCNAAGNTNAPGWVAGANVPIPESR
jgi:hypothetical protein